MAKVPTAIRFETDPEVISYVHQASLEFEPFVTPQTVIKVLAKDAKGIEKAFSKDLKSEKFRICIILEESGTQIEGEGISFNIFEAITKAKEQLLQKLNEIQDSIISNKDRDLQIREVSKLNKVH